MGLAQELCVSDPLPRFARPSPLTRGTNVSPPCKGGEPPGAKRGGRGSLTVALLLLLAPNFFGQAAVGNEKFDQKEYQAAIDAYEKVPQAMRDATILNRLGISYHLLNRLRP